MVRICSAIVMLQEGTQLFYHDVGVFEPEGAPARFVGKNELLFVIDPGNTSNCIHVITYEGMAGYVNRFVVEAV